MSSTIDRINQVFQEVFDDDELTVDRPTTADDVEGWDSLMHVTLLVNIEKAFGIKFSSSEVASLKNVGELTDMVDNRLGKREDRLNRPKPSCGETMPKPDGSTR